MRTAVAAMRHKMLAHLDTSSSDCFDVKQGQGGLVDIEFFIQCQVLSHAHRHEALCRWTDNVRLLDTLAVVGEVTADSASALKAHYLFYRTLLHRRDLAGLGRCVPWQAVADHPQAVRRLTAPCLTGAQEGDIIR